VLGRENRCAAYIADHHEEEAEEMREELQQLKLKMNRGQVSKELRDVRKDRRASGSAGQQYARAPRGGTAPTAPAAVAAGLGLGLGLGEPSSASLHPATYVRPTHRERSGSSASSSLPHPTRRPGPSADDDVRA
tara:strand:+ start:431 stop:832 length:402 start_codon:yes stop_codon:yes gene_type:complete